MGKCWIRYKFNWLIYASFLPSIILERMFYKWYPNPNHKAISSIFESLICDEESGINGQLFENNSEN